jgi:hypothetical protein
MRVGVRYLDEIAEYLIVADLERVDAGAGAFFCLNPGNRILPTIAQYSPLIELAVETIPYAGLIPDCDRWSVDKSADYLVGEISATIPCAGVPGKSRIVFGRYRCPSTLQC